MSLYQLQPIDCENPVIIRNPYLDRLILEHGGYVLNGQTYILSQQQLDSWVCCFPLTIFSPKRNGIDISNYTEHYIFDIFTGEVYPMYYAVPCNHCLICRKKKADSWATRCLMETQVHDYFPIFLTLTYSNENLPSDGVSKRDVQLFLNRLRMRFIRSGYDCTIRYICVAEYGKNTHRAHYHLILWGIPSIDVRIIHDIFVNTWMLGYINWSYIGKDGRNSAVGYVVKYMRKECFVPRGCNPTFFLCSKRNGGIGYSYYKNYIDYYRANPTSCMITIQDKFSNNISEFPIPKAFVIKTFPPISSIVPKSIRDDFSAFLRYVKYIRIVQHTLGEEFPFLKCDYSILLAKYSFLPQGVQLCSSYDDVQAVKKYISIYQPDVYLNMLIMNCNRLAEKLMYYDDYSSICEYFIGLKRMRQEMLLSKPSVVYNTFDKIKKIKKNLDTLSLREIF